MYYDVDDKFYELQGDSVFYFLLTGMSYREIANEFYCRRIYQFIYRVRKLLKRFHLQNRRQLAYFAVKNKLVDIERIGNYS